MKSVAYVTARTRTNITDPNSPHVPSTQTPGRRGVARRPAPVSRSSRQAQVRKAPHMCAFRGDWEQVFSSYLMARNTVAPPDALERAARGPRHDATRRTARRLRSVVILLMRSVDSLSANERARQDGRVRLEAGFLQRSARGNVVAIAARRRYGA